MSAGIAKCPLFGLPLELRDAIYDIVAVNEPTLALRIDIEQGSTPDDKHARAGAYTVASLDRTCVQLRREYSAALKRRINALMTPKGDLNGLRLMCFVDLNYHITTNGLQPHETRAHISELRYSTRRHVRKIHALATFIPIDDVQSRLPRPNDSPKLEMSKELAVMFVTDGSNQLAHRLSLNLSLQLIVGTVPLQREEPSEEVSQTFEEIRQVVKGTRWGVNARYYSLWYDFVIRCGPKKKTV